MPKQLDWYSTPLYYDIIFDSDTKNEVTFLEQVFAAHATLKPGKVKRVMEPACGSARLTAELAARGWRTYGFDLMPEMIEFSRKRLAKHDATLWVDRMESFTVPGKAQFELAHTLVSTFKYVLDQGHAEAHLQRMADVVKPGGLYVLGVHLTDYKTAAEDHERWVGERKGVKVVCNIHSWPANSKTRREKVRSRLRVVEKGETKVQETTWDFRTYSAMEMKALLATEPRFELVQCYDFTHNFEQTRKLDDEYSDIVLVLRRKS
jgi:SAM-dependent methyltransferase